MVNEKTQKPCDYLLISANGNILLESNDLIMLDSYRNTQYGGKSNIYKNTPKSLERARLWVRSNYYIPYF
jgi:hypothetical protein